MNAPRLRRIPGFTLVEILCVLALVAIMSALALPAYESVRRNAALTTAGNRLADAFALARQTASSRNTFTCLVLMTNTSSSGVDEQALTVLEYETLSAVWKPAIAWLRLPREVTIADVSEGAERVNARQAAVGLAPMDLRLAGASLSPDDCTMVLLHPEGGLAGNAAAPRQFSARLATDSPPATGQLPLNYYDVIVSADSAALRILRP
jgi:prepilin-type N-terminal cleavage/methylation domain-containing protein